MSDPTCDVVCDMYMQHTQLAEAVHRMSSHVTMESAFTKVIGVTTLVTVKMTVMKTDVVCM